MRLKILLLNVHECIMLHVIFQALIVYLCLLRVLELLRIIEVPVGLVKLHYDVAH